MPRALFSPAARVGIGPSLIPLPAAEHLGERTLRPGQRIIDGRVFYSAAWLDQVTSTFSDPLYAAMTRCAGAGSDSNQRPLSA